MSLQQSIPPLASGTRGLRRFLATAFGLVLSAAIAASVIAAGSPSRTIAFQASTDAIANPERGWYDRIDSILDGRDYSTATAGGITLLHSYVRLDEFRDRPLDAELLSRLGSGLTAVRAAGLKVVLRFAYNDGPYPDSQPDASEAVIVGHLKQLAPVLAANVGVVYAVEAGFIGAWGEWHSSTNGLDADPAAEKRILTALLAAVPSSRDVVLRYPSDIQSLVGPPATSTVGGTTAQARVGNHQDCFLASDPGDAGTWGRTGGSPAAEKAVIAQRARYAVVGGETCNPSVPARTNCVTALRELSEMGFSYLNRDYEPNSLRRLTEEGCATEIGKRLGYRLEVRNAVVPVALARTSTSLPVSFTVANTGFASVVNARTAYLRLRGPGTDVTTAVPSDPRSWDAGKLTTAVTTMKLSGRLAAGRYTLSLWLPDAAADLRANAAYSIRLATTGVWQSTTGDNRLAVFDVG
ncbi:hypothetical protein ASF62_02070 [Leifsonia sp. Leaf325]|nr:DUF4832 domain-containing protein [Leifsonia sp. Leaf325]KQQ95347.1 hypothetical protein ASF62_02070 [Leifsonia sp. Leaf325]